jgi:hypothetical protein
VQVRKRAGSESTIRVTAASVALRRRADWRAINPVSLSE